MNYFETKAGHEFFEAQFPRMIDALETIAEALSPPPKTLMLDAVPDEEFLSDLYYGNYEPEKYQFRNQLNTYNQQVSEAASLLRRHLTPEAHQLFKDYLQTTEVRNNAEAKHAYISGFRTAVQMFLNGIAMPHTVPAVNNTECTEKLT